MREIIGYTGLRPGALPETAALQLFACHAAEERNRKLGHLRNLAGNATVE